MSEQDKGGSNNVKHCEEKNIPWSQQVDEALFDNTSPLNDDTTGSVQFQYPPFNPKDNSTFNWYSRNKKPSLYFHTNKKYGKQTSFHGIIKRTDDNINAWDTHNIKKVIENADQASKKSGPQDSDKFTRLENLSAISVDSVEKTTIVTSTSSQKTTTWASIASQPAKVISKVSLTPSNLKKKGPGMPPPPMVPGKHNYINSWDSPSINPPQVPSQQLTLNKQTNFERIENSRDEQSCGDIECFDDSSFDNFFDRDSNLTSGTLIQNNCVSVNSQNRCSSFPINVHKLGKPNEHVNSGPTNRLSERRLQTVNRYDITYSTQDKEINSKNNKIGTESTQIMIEKLCGKNNYNPIEIDLETARMARFFVIKSYLEDDIHRSIKYEIWCSTDHGNKRLDDAFKERQKEGGKVLLFFSVNGSGHFCGIAEMITALDYNSTSSVWSQDKWKGKFRVKWIYVKDVPNNKLRHIFLENNDFKPVTNSRDTQEVPKQQGIEVLQIIHKYEHSTSIFDDFSHYEKKQEEEVSSKKPLNGNTASCQYQSSIIQVFNSQSNDKYKDSKGRVNQKYIGSLGINNDRDRNYGQRSGYYNNYNDRRFDNNKSNLSYQHKHIQKDQEANRENNEQNFRNIQKYNHNKKEERQNTRHSDMD